MKGQKFKEIKVQTDKRSNEDNSSKEQKVKGTKYRRGKKLDGQKVKKTEGKRDKWLKRHNDESLKLKRSITGKIN